MAPITTLTYAQRASSHASPLAKQVLSIMAEKETNLCVSVDVTTKSNLLRIADACGPYICVVKTHIDIVEDFDADLVEQLQALAEKHNFLIWEDRKFADIGNTVQLQYSSGVYKIASWAHITNAHPLPGEAIVTGLAQVGLPLGRGLLLMAEMSSKGNLITPAYTAETLEIARRNREFAIGFVAMKRIAGSEEEDFVILTPGVQIGSKGDGLGQQYRTPNEVISESGCDVIIVGRGIYGSGQGLPNEGIVENAKKYQAAGWASYLGRLR